jgi:hypothetical protein
MSLKGRMQRLAAAARRQGLSSEACCPACRDRRRLSVIVRGREDDDGEVAWKRASPPACAVCGEVPEEVIEIVEQIVPARGEHLKGPRGKGSTGFPHGRQRTSRPTELAQSDEESRV